MIDWDTLVAGKLVQPGSGQTMHDAWGHKPAVSYSSEMRRVLDLPRRALELDGTERAEGIIDMITARFARPVIPGRKCRCAEIDPERHREEGCIERLRLPQAQALREISICGGLLGPIGVGHGKTLIDLLAPLAFRYYDPKINDVVLMVPPGLATQLEGDYAYYGQHFEMPQIVFHGIDYINTCNKLDTRIPLKRGAPTIHVVPYSRLSRPEATSWLERELKPQAVISDECFPGNTLVHTDEGVLPIGDIVEQRRGSHALSYDTENDRYVWRRILNRLRRDGNKPLVRVTHEHGAFVCTEDHKIWTSDGYIPAAALGSSHSLVRAPVPEVRRDVSNTAQGADDREVLHQELWCQRGAEGQEVAEALGREEAEALGDRRGDTGAARGLGRSTTRADVSGTGRERSANEAAAPPVSRAWITVERDGTRYLDEASSWSLPQLAGLLQGRHRDLRSEVGDRGRRQLTQDEEVEVSRSPQDRNPQLSRVVCVEVLERGGADGHSACHVGDPVYDLTVEGEHNYFANGVLVSNCHKLRNIKSATGNRVWRYMEEVAPHTKFVGMSGSMTAKRIQDYWHLAKWSLRGGSPLPIDEEVVNEWGTALNPSDNPADPGRLMQLCAEGEHLHSGFGRRVAETIGVVTTTAPAVDVALELSERKAPPIPEDVRRYLADVRESAVRPDGEELLTSLEIAACAMQIACGFYYRWIYPRCEFPRDEQLVIEWRETRRLFFKEVRTKLKNLEEHMDSPRLVMNAAERFHGLRPKKTGLPVWDAKAFPAWHKIRGLVQAETEAVCFNDYLVRDAIDWATTHQGVVWYEHDAIGEWMAKLSGLPKYGGGKAAKAAMLGDPKKGARGEDGSRSIICSVKAHGTGTNGLQHRFHEAMLFHITPDPNAVEQVLGRLHRPGQNHDVTSWFYRHTPEMKQHIDDALTAAYYVESTRFGHQKIIRAYTE